MPSLVDGHNLIPKLGLRLDSPDDEMELVGILQEFARLARQEVEVYFDAAPAGQAGSRKFGAVSAHFVRMGSTADDAIKARLKSLGRGAKNWTVVSSDRQVQVAARAVHAVMIPSEEFAARLERLRKASNRPPGEPELTSDEVQEWIRLFEGKK